MAMTDTVMNRKDRMTYGEQNFEKYILPLVQTRFPGHWHSCNGEPLDYEHGIDYVVLNGACMTTIAARIWLSMPRQHFALRWKRTSDPFRKLELDSRLDAFHHGGLLPDWTIEGFHFQGKSYIAMIPTVQLLKVVDQYFETFPKFMVRNKQDHTIFKKISFLDYDLNDHIIKIIDDPIAPRA